MPPAPETRYRGNVFALTTENRSKGLNVAAETCIPKWGGEALDADMVLEALYDLEKGKDRPDNRR